MLYCPATDKTLNSGSDIVHAYCFVEISTLDADIDYVCCVGFGTVFSLLVEMGDLPSSTRDWLQFCCHLVCKSIKDLCVSSRYQFY